MRRRFNKLTAALFRRTIFMRAAVIFIIECPHLLFIKNAISYIQAFPLKRL
jgi:hypothetical protein